jgi:5-methylthioadenosine/S-adenosylhomocysteine deaminase
VATSSSAPAHCDLLIRNAVILTVDPSDTVLDRGAVAVRANRICDVGPDAAVSARVSPARVIDASGGVVHPGFIDAHVHISQYTSRSVLSRMEGTRATMGDWKSSLTPEDEHASAALAAVDYLKSGYTGFVDPGTIFEPDAVAAVAAELGIRIWLTDPYVADLGVVLKQKLPELANDRFLARWPQNRDEALRRLGSQLFRNREPDGLVRAFIGLYGEGTDSDELFHAASDVARSNCVRVQKHLGYSPETYLEQEAKLGRSMVEHLADRGHLSDNVTFIHMNVVHQGDVPLLAAHGVRIVWCPYGQLQMLGRGKLEGRMVQLARAGVVVGIGSDIARATHVGALGTLAIGAAAATGLQTNGREVLRMRTLGAAGSVGADDAVGSIEVGKYADIVIRKPRASEHLAHDHALEFGAIAGSDSIAAVIVNGRTAVADGAVTNADEDAIVQRAQSSARRLCSSLQDVGRR